MTTFQAMTDDEEKQFRQELLMADLDLRRKQGFWETPRNIVILLGVAVAIAGALGYKIGREPSPPPVVIYLTPQGQTAPPPVQPVAPK
jgi:hypothetical protein